MRLGAEERLRKTLVVFVIAFLSWPATAQALELTDEAGRRMCLPEQSSRIVALAPSITEIVFALGAGDRLVGVTRFSNYPPAAAKLAKVGSYVSLSIEKILALRPDLVIGIKDGNPKDVVDRLSELGIPVYIVNPKSLREVLTTIGNIGRVIGAESAAVSLTRRLAQRIHQVERTVAGGHRPRVFFQIGLEPIVSAGQGTFINELIRKAGGINVAGNMASYPQLSLEQVLLQRPDIILISSMARQGKFAQVKRFWQQWPGLPAVIHDRIYIVDSDICDRPSPRLVEGLEMLARLLHPDRFASLSPRP